MMLTVKTMKILQDKMVMEIRKMIKIAKMAKMVKVGDVEEVEVKVNKEEDSMI